MTKLVYVNRDLGHITDYRVRVIETRSMADTSSIQVREIFGNLLILVARNWRRGPATQWYLSVCRLQQPSRHFGSTAPEA